jgi:hypothetical protein
MKAVLILAICAAFIVPTTAWAGELSNPLVRDMKLTKGKYILPAQYARSSASFNFNEKTTKVEFVVNNGDSSGKNRVSSAKIVLLDEKGSEKAIVISPHQFNQNKSIAVQTIDGDMVSGLTDLNLDIQVGGPKDGFIVLNVTEYYESDEPCPWYNPFCN